MGTQVPGGQDSGWPSTDVRFALVWQYELTFLGFAFLELRSLQFQECADVETQFPGLWMSNCACVCGRGGRFRGSSDLDSAGRLQNLFLLCHLSKHRDHRIKVIN